MKEYLKFLDKLKHLKANDTLLCSYDVKSFFTNVILNEVTDICAETLCRLENPTLKRKILIR